MGLISKMTLYNLGDLALRHGDLAGARAYFVEALRNSESSGEQRAIHASLSGVARLAAALGDFEEACPLCAVADALAQDVGLAVSEEMRSAHERLIGLLQAELGVKRFATLVRAGQHAPVHQVADAALGWLESASVAIRRVPADGQLSQREMEVLRLLAAGTSNRDIAERLSISLNTVARHVSNIFDKIGAANRTEAPRTRISINLSGG